MIALTETDYIPDFTKPKYHNLVDTIKNGTCVFFGAGVSKLAGYRLWDELKYEMINYFWENRKRIISQRKLELDFSLVQNLKKHPDIIEVFDCLYVLDKFLFNDGIKEIFSKDEKKEKPAIYHELGKLNNNNNFFITTNIDKGFERFLGIAKKRINVFPSFNSNDVPLLTYLHGIIDDSTTWVFTRNQYDSAYIIDSKPCTLFLKDIFEKYSVLFIGYGLMDFEIKQAISLTSKRKEHYWLEATSRSMTDHLSIRATTLQENYNIQLISYSVDGQGHSVILKLLNQLHSATEKR